MRLRTTPHSFNLRMDDQQHAELARLAGEAGLPVQQYIELCLFGRIRPRVDPRAPRKAPRYPQPTLTAEDDVEELPIAG
jgi:predicted HicB family RNase H-like nuclease